MNARRDGRVHRGPESRALVGLDHVQRPAQHVRVDLHEQGILEQTAGDGELVHRHVMALEGLDDRPRAECRRFDQRPVDVFGTGAQRRADEHSAELVIDEHRAVAAVPVERDETVLTDILRARELGEIAMDVETATFGFDVVGRWDLLLDEPAEDVSDAALPGFVSEEARGDAAVDDAAHAGHLGQAIAVHDVARGRSHHRQHVAGLDRPRGRRRDVRVDVAHRDRDTLVQPRPGRPPAP